MLRLPRRLVLALSLLLLAPPAALAQGNDPPVVFVHGNGDTAALWLTQIWRFESNGYTRDKLQAIDLKYPSARSADDKPQEGRSSTDDAKQQLAAFVAEVKQRTGANKVALVGNSRGANTIRNYVKNGGGKDHVSHVVLGGGVNHGVIISAEALVGSEFNGSSEFMRQLNDGLDEVVEGVRFMTLRSDKDDKYAQPDGLFLGMAGKPTGISFDAPALKGAENVVLVGLDHREVSYAPAAFMHTFRFITGRLPDRIEILPESAAILNGKVTGLTANTYDNIGIAGAKVTIYAVDQRSGKRLGEALHAKTTSADGHWGPFTVSTDSFLEFVVEAPDQPITHIYRSPFPRGSEVVHLRPARFGKGEDTAASVVNISRPRGYFGHGRDIFLIDGAVPEGINKGVPGASTARLLLTEGAMRSIPVRFNLETFAVLAWPRAENRLVIAEFHY